MVGVGPAGCAARRGGFRRGNRELQYRNSRQSTNESDTQLGTYGPGADRFAQSAGPAHIRSWPRRPTKKVQEAMQPYSEEA